MHNLFQKGQGFAILLTLVGAGGLLGAGIYEGTVLNPLWSSDLPDSLRLIQQGSGIELQRFWIPLHIYISVAALCALIANFRKRPVRRYILVGLAAYIGMRVWSGFYFIPEMLSFQSVDVSTIEPGPLRNRIDNWIRLSWARMPLDVILFISFAFAYRRHAQNKENERRR